MSNVPPGVRKWIEEQKDYSPKDRTQLMEEMDEYLLKRQKRIEKAQKAREK
ncbi:hypothetical protein ACQKFO_23110 [Rossellomorea sp. NPDC071047]|uniref:hypothetical protein n=1 Tax=Rossellomorea sp. NPDC071047 TaxID=3390675 RepID=UPI003D02DE4C